jgi:hypothetical protein
VSEEAACTENESLKQLKLGDLPQFVMKITQADDEEFIMKI